MKVVFSVDYYARWEFDDYELYEKLEDADKKMNEYNEKRDQSCKNDNCCFARVVIKDINNG